MPRKGNSENTLQISLLKKIWCVVIAIVVLALLFVITPNWHWYKSADSIEIYLLENTPKGSSEPEVIEFLRSNDMKFSPPWYGQVETGTTYPPNTVAGSSFISALPGEYQIVFFTSVEAFYIFDTNGLLVEIAVRKTVDSL